MCFKNNFRNVSFMNFYWISILIPIFNLFTYWVDNEHFPENITCNCLCFSISFKIFCIPPIPMGLTNHDFQSFTTSQTMVNFTSQCRNSSEYLCTSISVKIIIRCRSDTINLRNSEKWQKQYFANYTFSRNVLFFLLQT